MKNLLTLRKAFPTVFPVLTPQVKRLDTDAPLQIVASPAKWGATSKFRPVPKIMRSQTIKLYDVNDYFMRHITVREAYEMREENEVELIRARGAKPGTFVAAKLKMARKNRETATTLTFRDVMNNAFGKAFNALGPTDSIRALDRAIEKVDAWPDEHDTKAVCISAGRVIQPATA